MSYLFLQCPLSLSLTEEVRGIAMGTASDDVVLASKMQARSVAIQAGIFFAVLRYNIPKDVIYNRIYGDKK